jgi:hypothetical protein
MTSTPRRDDRSRLYDAFQRVELDREDAIVDADVFVNSPAGRELRKRS